MAYTRRAGESDEEWLKRHDAEESDAEWRARTTPPNPANPPNPAETKDAWLKRIAAQLPGESYEDWRARNCQKYAVPSSSEPSFGWNKRKDAWLRANPSPATATAQGAPGQAATQGALPAAPTEDIPSFSTNAVFATAKVAVTSQCKRVRLAFHIFAIPGVDHPAMMRNVRRRTYKWVRRVFAQVGIAPKIVEINQQPLAPPVPNMISIYNYFGGKKLALCSGRDGSDQPSKLTIVIEDKDGDNVVERTVEATIWPANSPPPAGGVSPLQIGQAIVSAIDASPHGLHADLERVPKSDAPLSVGCDIFVTKDGRARRIKKVFDNDNDRAGTPEKDKGMCAVGKYLLQVPGLRLAQRPTPSLQLPADGVVFELGDNDGLIGGEPSQRRVLRMGRPGEDLDGAQRLATEPKDDRIDVYVVPKMALAGRAYPDYARMAPDNDPRDIGNPDFLPPTPLKNAVIVAYKTTKAGGHGVMDDSDASSFTLSHEIGHVLARTTHNEAQGDLMSGRWPKTPTDSGMDDKVIDTNGVHAAKRIYGAPLIVGTLTLKNNEDGTDDQKHYPRDMRESMRTRAPHLLADW